MNAVSKLAGAAYILWNITFQKIVQHLPILCLIYHLSEVQFSHRQYFTPAERKTTLNLVLHVCLNGATTQINHPSQKVHFKAAVKFL